MKRAILMSIQPQWLEKILNREKVIEIRKTMPKCELPRNDFTDFCVVECIGQFVRNESSGEVRIKSGLYFEIVPYFLFLGQYSVMGVEAQGPNVNGGSHTNVVLLSQIVSFVWTILRYFNGGIPIFL